MSSKSGKKLLAERLLCNMLSGLPPSLYFFSNLCVIIHAINLPVQHSIYNPPLSLLPSHRSTPPTNSSFPIMMSTSTPSPNNPMIDNILQLYPHCQGEIYGYDLNIQSCQDALQHMSADPIRRTYGTRDTGNSDIIVPHRYLSRKYC